MANVRLPTATVNAIANLVDDLVNGGAGAGTIQIRDGTQPASANDAAAGSLLATLTFSDPAFGAAAAGVITAAAITSDTSADNTGTATWARVLDSNSATVFDCDVGTSGATITLDSVSIVSGVPVNLTAFTFTAPAA